MTLKTLPPVDKKGICTACHRLVTYTGLCGCTRPKGGRKPR